MRTVILWDISLAFNMTYFLYVILNDSEESHRISRRYMLFSLVVGYFATLNMTYFLYVILSMSSEQTCLQGFANDYIYHLSLRGSVATAAIPWIKRQIICSSVLQGDRHAYARDDTEIQPRLLPYSILTSIPR